jgi:hypothetical protein
MESGKVLLHFVASEGYFILRQGCIRLNAPLQTTAASYKVHGFGL